MDLRKAVELGTDVLQSTGGVQEAAVALRRTWTQMHGNHLAGVHDPEMAEAVDPDLLAYLREVADEGVQARYQGHLVNRVRARPHASAAHHQRLAYEEAWKDTQKGRMLLVRADLPELRGVISSPQGAVPKLNPDRTESGKLRFINDMRLPNLGCDSERHPPAVQPRHRQLGRAIPWWQARCPNLPLWLAKKDVDAAFKRIWLHPSGVRLFGVELLGDEIGLGYDVLAVFLVLAFGWRGSPGEYMAWGWAVRQWHEAHRPAQEEWHDTVPFSSLFLMDDGVLVEPALGLRPWLSERTFVEGMTRLFSPDARNRKMDAEEGAFSIRLIVWGA